MRIFYEDFERNREAIFLVVISSYFPISFSICRSSFSSFYWFPPAVDYDEKTNRYITLEPLNGLCYATESHSRALVVIRLEKCVLDCLFFFCLVDTHKHRTWSWYFCFFIAHNHASFRGWFRQLRVLNLTHCKLIKVYRVDISSGCFFLLSVMNTKSE